MNIALYARDTLANKPDYIIDIVNKLKNSNSQLFICDTFYDYLKKEFSFTQNLPTISNTSDLEKNKVDYLISLGGDGTLLETLSLVKKMPIPVLGINTGKLGFLTYDFNQNIADAIQLILDKKFSVEKRNLIQLLQPEINTNEINYALNEVVIHKKDKSSMLHIDILINDNFLTSFFADGVIISTATGSTAYSLSCGGPILEPGLNGVIITAIASHSLNARPIVVSNQHKLSFKVSGRNPQYTLSMDSRIYDIQPSQLNKDIILTKANHQFHLVVPHPYHFFDSLRNKLYWGTDKRF